LLIFDVAGHAKHIKNQQSCNLKSKKSGSDLLAVRFLPLAGRYLKPSGMESQTNNIPALLFPRESTPSHLMPFSKLLLSYLLTFAVFFVIDMAWLGFIAKDLYRKHLSGFLSDEVNWPAAFIFYLLFIIGVFIFAILPAVEKDSVRTAMILGGLFGFFTYATYDLTNLATLRNWPVVIVCIDVVWGFVLTSMVSTAGFYIVKWIR